ncbi:MAG TPA: hypothetical protein VK362_19340 [Reyranella sp.]|nr:hypothetical protein [Reyranella sp.]
MISEFRNDTYALPDDIYFVWSLQNVAPTVLLLAMLVLSQATSSLAFAGRSPEDSKGRAWAWRFLLPGFVLTLLAFNVTRHYAVRDEVAVNLEHTFNLFHFGRFSMSPTALVDGTVEYAFYLLHLPFAASARLLSVGNWLICTLVAVLTLWLLGRGRLIGDARRNALFLLFPAAFSPLFLPMGTGFGNGLLSAAFVLQLIFMFRGRWAAAIAVAALLPLLRPDGTLWAMVLPTAILADRFAARFLPGRSEPPPPGLAQIALLYAAPLCAFAVYSAAVYAAYGHFPSTPVAFKQVFLPSLLIDFGQTVRNFPRELITDLGPEGILLIAALGFLIGQSWQSVRQDRVLRWAVLATLFAFGILVIYALGQATIGWFGNFYNRYGVNFFIAAFCLAALLVDDLLRRGRTGQATAWIVVLPALALLVNLAATTNPPPRSPLVNRESNFKAGALLQEIVAPTPLSVSTTEMNSFGLAVRDRQVLDYWGYSNPVIARSSTCNSAHNRFSATAFLDQRPDIFWPFWFTDTPTTDNYDTAETSLARSGHLNRAGNRLGDLERVMGLYDVIFLAVRDKRFAFLVRKDSAPLFMQRVVALGFVQQRQRPFDKAAFDRAYQAIPYFSYSC